MKSNTQQSESILLAYLAAHGAPHADQPTYEQLELTCVITVAKKCWEFRSNADGFAELVVPLADDRWRELCGLAGSIGESLMLAAACEIEVEWHRRARESGDLPPEMVLGQRFLSEAGVQAVMSIGHRLTNLVGRALVIDPRQRTVAATVSPNFKRWIKALTPFSENKNAWLSLNKDNARYLSKIAEGSPHARVRALADRLRALERRSAWRDLERQRGEDFHRWRKESASLAGVDRSSGYLRDVDSYDSAVVGKRLGEDPEPYGAANGQDEVVANVARAALEDIAAATDDVIDQLEHALEPLSHGRIVRRHDGGFTVHPFGDSHWSDDDCTCCSAQRGNGSQRPQTDER